MPIFRTRRGWPGPARQPFDRLATQRAIPESATTQQHSNAKPPCADSHTYKAWSKKRDQRTFFAFFFETP